MVADELIRFSSVLKLAYNLVSAREYLKRKKFREHKKLVSIALPFSDLVYAFPDLIPVFPIRMHTFNMPQYFSYLGTASNIFGMKNVSNFLGFAKNLGIKEISQTIDNIIEDVIEAINEKYNEMYDVSLDNGLSSDFCFGLKTLYGMHVSKGKNCDANLNFTIRCSAFNKYLESLKALGNPSRQIWVDIPPRNIGNSLEILTANINKGVKELESISDNNYSDNALIDHFKVANQIRKSYKTIIHEISTSDFLPCNPATFAEILSLLSISFQDYNSNAIRFRDNIATLVNEMKERMRKGIGMDVSDRPRILVTPMFGGWEPKTHDIIYELGGRVLYADWDILMMLEEIPITRRSDPIEAYAEYLQNMTSNGIGCDNDTLTNSYLRLAKELNADGLVFVQLFGCHSISNCYAMLKQKIRRELEIPSIALTFNKIGENVEQVKTRLGAFMEMYK